MRLKARVDKNQPEMVEYLRKIGCNVIILSQLGNGVGDLLVSFCSITVMVEIKKDKNGKLTPDEEKFCEDFQGFYIVAYEAKQILAFMLSIAKTYYMHNAFLIDALEGLLNGKD